MKKLAFLLIVSLMATACSSQSTEKKIRVAITKIARKVVPDKRVEVCDVSAEFKDKCVVLSGVTTNSSLKGAFEKVIQKEGYTLMDSIELLPQKSLKNKIYGVVNQSVIMMRAKRSYSSEAMTQAILGQPVRVLQKNSWYRIQTPDDYIGWTHRSSIVPMTKQELMHWNKRTKVVITSTYAFSYESPEASSQRISDLVQGNRLAYVSEKGNFYKITYPDGTLAYVAKKDAMMESDWEKENEVSASAIIKTAFTLMGIPYRWGGTSTKAMDCSGFVKTCYFLHGIILQRDASQMAYVAEKIEINKQDFSNLRPGDLLFFGRPATKDKKERVVHVGLYIGNERFIHAQGHVFVSSFNASDSKYDAYNLNRLLWATRVLPHIGEKGISTLVDNPYYNLK
jgi:cell wall-associated NlpC family hydrolase